MTMNTSTRTLILLTALALGLSSCATLRGETADAADETQRAQQLAMRDGEAKTIAANDTAQAAEAFNFAGKELFSGATISGADLQASGPVIMTFVSPDCDISVEEGAELAAAAELEEDITYVFVHGEGTTETYEAFVDKTDLFQQNVIHIDDSNLALANRFSIDVRPTMVLGHDNGTVSVSTGGLSHKGITEAGLLVRG